jgi:sigma-B regulation protein RsbU (phosphoserine phosphatase)
MKVEDATKQINNLIYELTDEERFVTLFYGIVDTRSRALRYTNAGHFPPLLFKVSSSEAQWLEPGGPVLGLFPNAGFESASAELRPGDLLLLYTDGVIEAYNQFAEEYSRERLLSVVKSHHTKTAQQLVATTYVSVIEFTGTNILEDDLTVLVLKAV